MLNRQDDFEQEYQKFDSLLRRIQIFVVAASSVGFTAMGYFLTAHLQKAAEFKQTRVDTLRQRSGQPPAENQRPAPDSSDARDTLKPANAFLP